MLKKSYYWYFPVVQHKYWKIPTSIYLLNNQIFHYILNMKYFRNSFFIFGILLLVSACGMGGAKQSASYMGDAEYAPMAMERSASMDGANFSTESAAGSNESLPESPPLVPGVEQTRKLVKRANLSLRVEDPEATEKPLADLMQKYGAWSASTGIYDNSRNYTIRVPSLSYDAMLAELSGLGKIQRRTENAEDVTLHYYDLESRLATKRELLKTYQGYLGKANNIDEIMTVEYRIAELQREIDSTGTQFRNLANLVDYATIELGIAGPASISTYSEPTLGEKLKELFGSFSDVASSAFVVLTGIIIYGVPAFLIVLLLFWVLFGRIGLLKKLWRLAAGKRGSKN